MAAEDHLATCLAGPVSAAEGDLAVESSVAVAGEPKAFVAESWWAGQLFLLPAQQKSWQRLLVVGVVAVVVAAAVVAVGVVVVVVAAGVVAVVVVLLLLLLLLVDCAFVCSFAWLSVCLFVCLCCFFLFAFFLFV